MFPWTLRTGGQSGVDRAALDFAICHGIAYGGWCPRGGWAEDYPMPPGLLVDYPHLQETPAPEPNQRSYWNVRDSDATLILIIESVTLQKSTGTVFTTAIAQTLNRPCLVVEMGTPGANLRFQRWWHHLWDEQTKFSKTNPFCFNIAGPRESEVPGIYQHTFQFLQDAFWSCSVP